MSSYDPTLRPFLKASEVKTIVSALRNDGAYEMANLLDALLDDPGLWPHEFEYRDGHSHYCKHCDLWKGHGVHAV